ncbi:MAG: hypothetical protein DHS20C18_31150 [Saprospiraceae bacterium]|nr:MAG: hypothetical protein DHS20C18_31150 [Saprospiraceae bacterium]
MMMTRSIKRRLLRARISLNQTIQRILDINRKRKNLSFTKDPIRKNEDLNEELKLLNKLAEQQAKLVRNYENSLAEH